MRAFAALLLFASACAIASNVPVPVDMVKMPHRMHVDLDQPGAFQALRTDNPKHFARIRKIIRMAEALPNAPTAEWMSTNFDAKDVFAMPIWQVTDPPRMSLSFRLDDIRYSTTIVARYQPQFVPVR